jgi:hypothetical protein
MRVANSIPLGCPLFLPVHTVNCVQTLKVEAAGGGVNGEYEEDSEEEGGEGEEEATARVKNTAVHEKLVTVIISRPATGMCSSLSISQHPLATNVQHSQPVWCSGLNRHLQLPMLLDHMPAGVEALACV